MVVDVHGAVHIAAHGANGICYLTNETVHLTRTRLARDGGPRGSPAIPGTAA
jgi:hypothetical protein